MIELLVVWCGQWVWGFRERIPRTLARAAVAPLLFYYLDN